MSKQPDPSERPTLPPIGDDPLPREQERLLMRFGALVARETEETLEAFKKQGAANEANWRLVVGEIKSLRETIERQAQFDQALEGRIGRLERIKESDSKAINEKLDALTSVDASTSAQVKALADQVKALADKFDQYIKGNGPRAA